MFFRMKLKKQWDRKCRFLGVRFISVNDHYDSDTKEGTAGDWDVVFKNFLYDLYSKDLSKKTTAAKRSKARKG